MKPTILCGKCQNPLTPGSKFCNLCGTPVEWSADGGDAGEQASTTVQCKLCGAENTHGNTTCVACGEVLEHDKPAVQQKRRTAQKKKSDQPLVLSWKMIAGFVVFLAVGVFGLEFLTAGKFTEPPHIHDEETTPTETPAANMQALQQIEDLEQRLTASPNDQSLRIQLANTLHDARFYDKAIQRYHEYLNIKPDDVDARVDLGICYYEVDRSVEAKQEMLKALEYNAKHILGHFNLGIVNLRIAQTEMTAGNSDKASEAVSEANEWFRKTVALDPNGSAGQRAQRFIADHSNQPNLLTN